MPNMLSETYGLINSYSMSLYIFSSTSSNVQPILRPFTDSICVHPFPKNHKRKLIFLFLKRIDFVPIIKAASITSLSFM